MTVELLIIITAITLVLIAMATERRPARQRDDHHERSSPHHRRQAPSTACSAITAGLTFLVAVAISVLLAVAATDPAKPVVVTCHAQKLIDLSAPSGELAEFTVDAIAAVLPNPGTFPEAVHAVIVLNGAERVGVKQSMLEVIRRLNAARCTPAQ